MNLKTSEQLAVGLSRALAVELEVGEIAAERQALAVLVGGQEGHS